MNLEGRILVTGGAGFIGSNFVRHMLDSYPNLSVLVLDKFTYAGNPANFPKEHLESGRLEVIEGDVADGACVAHCMRGCEGVVHFAAETHVTRSIFDSSRFVHTDIIGTQVLLTAALDQERPPHFIHVSTSEVYGSACSPLMTEEHALNPMSPYAAAKTGADRLVYSFVQTYGLPATTVRPFNNFGPRQHLEKVLPRFITGAITGEPLRVHGDGSARRDFVYVEDTCRAIESLALLPGEDVRGEVFNIATGHDVSNLELANAVMDRFPGSNAAIEVVSDRPGQVFRHTGGAAKLTDKTGWQPRVAFAEGLELTCQWYQENEDWWRPMWDFRQIPIRLADGRVELH